MNRRHFLFVSCLAAFAQAQTRAENDGRELDIVVDPKDFGAPADNIRAVLLSVASEIWKHCATTGFEFGFRVYHNPKYPITHYEREEGRIIIGLAVKDTFWAQYAFQFAHEFCHALMGHSRQWRRLWHMGNHANRWVEETLCEVASLFALRSMENSWKTAPPYPNWKDFGKNLGKYAQERLDDPRHQLPAGKTFAQWLVEAEPVQREKWTRENNTIVAARLLPIFEADPTGWDAVAAINLCKHEEKKPLARFLEEWKTNAQPQHSAFIEKVVPVFSL